MSPDRPTGTVWLVGAGPGDPGLITAAGLRRLREADAVVFDALANPVLLDEARADAQRIDVGKRGGEARAHTQARINDLLVELAQQGKKVVRLKGGDPLLFGRGAEEAAHLAAHGIGCEVIPGVTSGIAAPAAAGIALTRRDVAGSVTFITGHPSNPGSATDYAALARLMASGGTVCFYMGAGRLTEIARALVEAGADARTPAAIVQWGTLPRQRSLRATLGTIAEEVEREGIGAPAIVVVGAAAGADPAGLDSFTKRPLFGRRVLVTRTRSQASRLRQLLADLGAEVLEAPTIEVLLPPPEDCSKLDAAIRDLSNFRGDWLIVTSVNGVDALAQRLAAMGLDARALGAAKIAAVGPATAEALWDRLRLRCDLVPRKFVAATLVEELIGAHALSGRRVMLLRGDRAEAAPTEALRQAGASVTDVIAYRTQVVKSFDNSVLDALRRGEVDWVTFTSSSTATNLAQVLGGDVELMRSVRIASIGPVTSATVRGLGWRVAVEAAESTVEGLAAAIAAAERGGAAGR